MANAIDSVSNILREELPKVMHESLPQVAPFFKDIVSTSVGVSRDTSTIGRDWKVTHLYSAGLAGLMKYASPNGPSMITAGNMGVQTHMLNFSSLSSPFPKAVEAPHAGTLKRQIPLHMTTGNFSVPLTWMQTDALDASQMKQVGMDIKAVGDLRAMVEATGFHSYVASSASYEVKVLGVVNAVTEISSSNVVTVTLHEEYGTIHNFRVGMVVDFYNGGEGSAIGTFTGGTDTDGSDIRNYTQSDNYVHCVIQNVDYINRNFDVVGVDSSDGAIEAYGSTHGWTGNESNPPQEWDYLVLRDCGTYSETGTRPMPTWGLEDWIKSSGTILGGASAAQGLDLDEYSQFKSSVTAVNGPLTEDVLNKYVGNYLDAYPGMSLDTIITTNGVTQKHLQQYGLYNNRAFFDRTGKSLSVKGGWAEVGYEFNGRVLRWIVDPLCLKGRLYGLKLAGGNIKRYQPPSISSSKGMLGNSNAGTDGEIQFLAPLGGHTGVFMLARDSSAVALDILEAPFFQYNLIAPIMPNGLKLTGLTETALT